VAARQPGSLARVHPRRELRLRWIRWGAVVVVAVVLIVLAAAGVLTSKSPAPSNVTGTTGSSTSVTGGAVTRGATDTGPTLSEQTVLRVPAASALAQANGASFVTDDQRNLLLRFDPATGVVQQSLHLAGRPDAMLFGGGDLWIAEMDSNLVVAVNPATMRVVQSVSVPPGPSGLAVLGSDVWVASVSANEVTPIDEASGTLGTPVQILAGAVRVAAGFGALWVSGSADLVTRVVPAAGDQGPPAQRATTVGQGPIGITTGNGSVWVANSLSGTVSQIDPTSLAVTNIPAGNDPVSVQVASDNRVYVGLGTEQAVRVVSPSPESKELDLDGTPRELLPVSNGVWVATASPGRVYSVK
jgi:streptogramin lyase